jgi:RimJ/RimL family protein N-acetyltransferase
MTLAEFTATHEAALERSAARHIMMLGLLETARGDDSSCPLTWSLGAPGQCAMMRPGAPLLLGDLDQAQCHAFAETVAEVPYPGVVGPDRTAPWFCERAVALGARFIEPMPQRMHALTEKPVYPGSPGNARLASADDADLLTDWMKEFLREATPHDEPPSREQMARKIPEGRYFLWVVDSEPVSTAAIVRRTRTAGGIAAVYTPAPHRAKGYAGSVTAAVAEHLFGEGRTMACVNTDLRNPASNRCYEKIGFRPVCDLAFFARVATK